MYLQVYPHSSDTAAVEDRWTHISNWDSFRLLKIHVNVHLVYTDRGLYQMQEIRSARVRNFNLDCTECG